MNKNIFDITDKTLSKRIDKKNFAEFEKSRKKLLQAVGSDLAQLIGPAITDAVSDAIKIITSRQTINIEPPKVTIPAPIVNVSAPSVPDIKVPTPIANVTVPPIKIPDINVPRLQWPEGDMPIKGSVTLEGINAGNPLSVQIRDSKGKPVDFNFGSDSIINAGGGGIAKQIRISNTDSNPVPVTFSSTGTSAVNMVDSSGIAYSGSNPVPVSASISGFTASIASVPTNTEGIEYNSDNPLPVTITSGASATTASVPVDVDGIAYDGDNPAPVQIAAGDLPDTAAGDLAAINAALGGALNVSGATVTVDLGVNNDVTMATLPDTAAGDLAAINASVGGVLTVDATGQGDVPITLAGESVVVSSITATTAVSLIDSTGVQYSGSNPVPVSGTVAVSGNITSTGAYLLNGDGTYRSTMPVSGTVAVSGVTASIAASLIDSSGVQYSSSNPVPIDDAGGSITVDGTVAVSGLTGSVSAVPTNAEGVEYDSSNPQPVTEITVRSSYKTAYASVTNGTETTILTGEASYYHDLVWIMCANQSDAAVTLDLRETTAGTVMATIEVPANGTAGIAPALPLPQSNISGAWTADMDDITGTTVDITALFKKEA